jgi:hypothetical protein
VALREKEAVALAALATEEGTIARLSAQLDSRMEFSTDRAQPQPIVSRGQRSISERLRDEATRRLGDAEAELETIRHDLAAARVARDARVRVEFAPKKRAAVLALRQAIVALMRVNQNLADIENAEARALEVRSPSECGASLALPGWLENTNGVETRVEFWERLQSIKTFLGE